MGDMHANVWSVNNKIMQMSIQKESHLLVRLWSFNHSHGWPALVILLIIQLSPPATAQFSAPQLDPNNNDKSVFAIMGIVVIMFFISGFLSLYSRQCAGRRTRIRGTIHLTLPTGDSEPRGLNQEIIDTFPTFIYSDVKGLKIGKGTLACAVCLNEFQDQEILRLIPKCNHVFHPNCIDVWLASHSTCPVCRANLVPTPEDMPPTPAVSIQIPYDQDQHPDEEETVTTGEDAKRDRHVESPEVDLLHRSRTMNHSHPTRSRSTGFLFAVLFPRSNSTGHPVMVQPGQNFERFTLRLPDEVRSQVLNSALKRTNSCVDFTRMSSGRSGYRTRSVGCGRGRSYLQYDRFGCEEQSGFTLTPPFFT